MAISAVGAEFCWADVRQQQLARSFKSALSARDLRLLGSEISAAMTSDKYVGSYGGCYCEDAAGKTE